MGFKFFKRSEGDAPPDVGQEEAYDQSHGDEFGSNSNGVNVAPMSAAPQSSVSPASNGVVSGQNSAMSAIEVEKLNARVDSVIEWIKQFYERFTYLSESIGGVRAIAMANEKEISKVVAETSKAIDMVNELEPDKLMVNYQKINLRITGVSERVEAIKQIHETLVTEIQELKRQADVFIGAEGMLKLNEEVKKDLIETKKLSSTVRVHSDKAEQIFMEIRKGFEESQKNMELVRNLEANYDTFRKEFEKMKIEATNSVKSKEFYDLKNAVEKVKDMNGRINGFGAIVEKSLELAKKNEEDIADIAVTIGKENIKKVSDYENQLASVLEIMASFAAQLRELKNSKDKEETKRSSKKVDDGGFEKKTGLEKGVESNEAAIESLRQKLNMVESSLKQKIKSSEEKDSLDKVKLEEKSIEQTPVVESKEPIEEQAPKVDTSKESVEENKIVENSEEKDEEMKDKPADKPSEQSAVVESPRGILDRAAETILKLGKPKTDSSKKKKEL